MKYGDLRRLERLLSRLSRCDLSNWDATFCDDLTKRADRYGERMEITGRQWAQLERMKDQYHVDDRP